MKKTNLTILTVAVFAAATLSSNVIAQEIKPNAIPQKQNKQNQQMQTQTVPQFQAIGQQQAFQTQQGQQQMFVDPGFSRPTPKLGFQGQIIVGFGMKVVSVNWGSAAQAAGLETGDIITKINGRMIRSQWDYEQALLDASRFYNGRVNMMVRNVRFDWGHHVPEYVMASTVLDGFGAPVGPIGPQVAVARSN